MKNMLLEWRRASSREEWCALADKSGTSTGYLNLIAYGHRTPSPKLAVSIENASVEFPDKPKITKELLVFFGEQH